MGMLTKANIDRVPLCFHLCSRCPAGSRALRCRWQPTAGGAPPIHLLFRRGAAPRAQLPHCRRGVGADGAGPGVQRSGSCAVPGSTPCVAAVLVLGSSRSSDSWVRQQGSRLAGSLDVCSTHRGFAGSPGCCLISYPSRPAAGLRVSSPPSCCCCSSTLFPIPQLERFLLFGLAVCLDSFLVGSPSERGGVGWGVGVGVGGGGGGGCGGVGVWGLRRKKRGLGQANGSRRGRGRRGRHRTS